MVNWKLLKISLAALFLFSIVFSGISSVYAAGIFSGLVPCDTPENPNPCTLCDLFVLAKNVINLMIEISIALGTGFIIWGAFDIMLAGGIEKRMIAGRKKITDALIGIVIVLCAWLIVGTVFHIITGSPSKVPWTTIRCTK